MLSPCVASSQKTPITSISFISPVTKYYQQPCTPLASCEQKNKRRMVCRLCFLKKHSTQGYSGCFWSATPALNAAAKRRGRGGGAEGGSEEEGFDWVKRSTYATVLRNGGFTYGLVSVCHSLRLREKPWCTYCKEGFVVSYSTLGYRQQKCISLLSVCLNCKMCWSPFFLLRSPFTAGWRLKVEPGCITARGRWLVCNYKLKWLMSSNHI